MGFCMWCSNHCKLKKNILSPKPVTVTLHLQNTLSRFHMDGCMNMIPLFTDSIIMEGDMKSELHSFSYWCFKASATDNTDNTSSTRRNSRNMASRS